MSSLAALMSAPIPSELIAAREKSHVTYTCPSPLDVTGPDELTLMESRELISGSGTTGLRTWEAALHLGSYLLSSAGRELVFGKRVLELGAGTGFLSLLCAKHLGANRILATDGDQGVINQLEANIFLNDSNVSQVMEAGLLAWGRALMGTPVEQGGNHQGFDTVLGADLVRAPQLWRSKCLTLIHCTEDI